MLNKCKHLTVFNKLKKFLESYPYQNILSTSNNEKTNLYHMKFKEMSKTKEPPLKAEYIERSAHDDNNGRKKLDTHQQKQNKNPKSNLSKIHH